MRSYSVLPRGATATHRPSVYVRFAGTCFASRLVMALIVILLRQYPRLLGGMGGLDCDSIDGRRMWQASRSKHKSRFDFASFGRMDVAQFASSDTKPGWTSKIRWQNMYWYSSVVQLMVDREVPSLNC